MFVGRKHELEELSRFLEGKKPSIAVVYGRRRIGKSVLIQRALSNHPRVLFFEGLDNRPKKEQISNFVFQMNRQAKAAKGVARFRTWREAFWALEPILKKRPGCVVLDEFQWMANYRQEIVSEIKSAWDQCLSKIPGVHLILCGSIASFMTTKVIKSSALYGRTDLVIHLKGFRLHETSQMFPQKSMNEVIDAQLLFGGVPKYLELLSSSPSVHLAVEQLGFKENGYFLDEFDRIFTSHFGKNRDYKKIVTTLAKNPYGLFRQELAQKTGIKPGGGFSDLLFNLQSAGFITELIPFDKKANSRTIKYTLHDSYLRFYFEFIEPNRRKIRSGAVENLFSRIAQTGKFYAWRGRAFEYLCQDHVPQLADLLGFSAVDFNHGPYFKSASSKRPGVQIDLLFDRADNVLTLCEMKYAKAPLTKVLIGEVEKKAEVLESLFSGKTIQRVLVVHGNVADALKNSGYFYRIIQAVDLLK